MLRRKIDNILIEWKNRIGHKPLIVKGARQIGKTESIRHFGNTHYKYMVEINFALQKKYMSIFDGGYEVEDIIKNITFIEPSIKLIPRQTLIFFDELQDNPDCATSLKSFMIDGRFDVICSGSLMGINYNKIESNSVGYKEDYEMHSLDFEEFLWANGVSEQVFDLLRKSYQEETVVPDFIHQQISRYYRQFLAVGGMPEAVQSFVNNPDFRLVEKVHRSILTTYRADITQYAGKDQVLVKRVFDAIPSELAKEDKRFILADLEKGASRRKYEDPTQWLIDAGIAYYSFNTSAFELPFEATENRKLYKLYMVDTGLLGSILLKGIQFQVLSGDISVNEGALTENYVACALSANSHTLHYYDKNSKQELDFIIEEQNKIAIIEVKSGENYQKHPSLDAAIRVHTNKINRSIVLSRYNVSKKDGVLYLPLYMAMFL